jgi:LPXTG-motif cell wall-anchored protein
MSSVYKGFSLPVACDVGNRSLQCTSLSVVNPDRDQGGEHKGGDMQTPRFNRSSDGARRSRTRLGVIVGLAVAALVPTVALAQSSDVPGGQIPPDPGGDYVTTTIAERSLDVSAFSPECVRDAPFVSYTIVPVGFTPDPVQATLVITAKNGTVIDTRTVTSLSGRFIWPGASVDAAGNATDWPGWKRADDGVSWIPDPSDAFLREGLTITVTVNPTATATVSYPPATSACANPPGGTPPTLPQTGGGPGNALILGAGALLAGLLILTASRRRRHPVSSPSPS